MKKYRLRRRGGVLLKNCTSLFSRKKKSKYEEIPYQHLAPVNSVKDGVTFNALDYALNQENVHNVALTGCYGSGKSSILDSYIKSKRHCLFINVLLKLVSKIWFFESFRWFLKVSLATFAIESETEKQKDKLPETTIQKIEKSILQQIFYRKSGKKFPYSRFCRINKVNPLIKVVVEILIIFLFFVPVYFAYDDVWKNITDVFDFSKRNILEIVALIIFVIAFAVILYNVISLAYRVRFAKLSFKDAEIELKPKDEDSLLNKYYDEILYFFEMTEYNVVVFEDLDRFNNTEIFIKLRELNTLLNSYEKIKRRIVFIYALRDDVFENSSRTKFFDFIVPVIPVINNQNSGDVLVNLRNKNMDSVLKEIDEVFLQDIGLYIDDMRLLKNSINEFKIYDQKMNVEDYKINERIDVVKSRDKTSRDRNKIFALVLYKNLYPKDFADLICNKGELYEVFKEKKQLAGTKIKEIQGRIPPLEKRIEILDNQALKDVKELRVLYVATLFSKSSRYSYDIEDLYKYVSDEKFEKLRLQILSNGITFLSIEKEVDPQYTYDQREKMIKDKLNGEIGKIKRKIDECRNSISEMEQKSIKDMLQEFPEIDFVSNMKSPKKEFVDYLLRHGYIDEDYSRYISYFYVDSLSENDKRYLRLIKNNQSPNNFLLELSNFEKIVKRIQSYEWRYFAILNHSLLKYILQINDCHLDYFLNTLWKYKQKNLDCTFLSTLNVDYSLYPTLYNKIYKLFNDKNKWLQVLFEKESKSVHYKFFRYTDFEEKRDDVVNYLSKDVSFLYDPDVENDKEIIAAKFGALNLKFNLLNDTPEYPVYDILLDQNAYVISKQNFDIIVNHALGNDFKHIINDYYTQVSKLPNKKIKAYINENIEDFVAKVMLSSGKNIAESENAFVELLNMERLSQNAKAKLIEKNDCKISDLAKVVFNKVKSVDGKQVNLCDLLFVCGRVKTSWKNIFENFKYNGNALSKCLNDYLCDKKTVDEVVECNPLTSDELNNKNGNYGVARDFYQSLFASSKMSLECFSAIMSVCPWTVDDFDLRRISQEKMNYLIELKILKFSDEKYNLVIDRFESMLPKYVGLNFDEFIAVGKDLNVSFKMLKSLLDSKELNDEQKKNLLSTEFSAWRDIGKYSDGYHRIGLMMAQVDYSDDYNWLGKKVVELGYTGKMFVSLETIAKCLDSVPDLKKFILLQEELLKNNEIANIINSKSLDPYISCISRNGKMVKVSNTPEDLEFVGVLKKKGLIAGFKEEKDSVEVTQLSPNQ